LQGGSVVEYSVGLGGGQGCGLVARGQGWAADACGRCIFLVADIRVNVHHVMQCVRYLHRVWLCTSMLAGGEVMWRWFVRRYGAFLDSRCAGGHRELGMHLR
jgi:hypothetical protein